MAYGFYLYGIFPPPGPQGLSLQGVDQQPVYAQSVEGCIFLYSEAQQERYLASRRNLIGHAKVLEEAMQAGYRNLLPLPLNRLMAQNWEEVAEQFVIPYRTALQQMFQQLEGMREVSIKLYWEEEKELEQLIAENQTLRQQRDRLEGKTLSMDEVIGIGQTIESGLYDRRNDIIETFRHSLNGLAQDVVENDLQTDAMIYNAAYLIPWEKEAEFSTLVERLDDQFNDRLRIRYNNFTAPYNFAQLERFT
jgi:hypothetical protein